jgi:O-antigen ligase
MLAYYKENIQLYIILLVWLLVGMYGGPLIYGVLPISLILMKQRGMYEELLIGFIFILILSDRFEMPLRFAKDVKNIYIVGLGIFLLLDKKAFYPMNKLIKVFIPFFIVAFYCLMTSINEPFFFTSLQKTLSYILLFLVVPNYIQKVYLESGPVFFRNLLFFALTILLLGVILIFIKRNFVFIYGGRYCGILANPNGLGLFCLLMFILFSVVNRFHTDLFSVKEQRIFYFFLLLSIVLCESRNALVGILIFYIFQRFFSVSPFLGFIVFVIIVFTIEVVGNNLISITYQLGLSDYLRVKTLDEGSGRYVAWQFAWNHIQDNFFISKGIAYDEFYMRRHYELLSKLGHQGGIHNTFLTIWMDTGLIGLLIYLRSFILAFMRSSKYTALAFPIMFAITFSAIFESWLIGSLNPFTIIFVIILTLISSDIFHAPKEKVEPVLI